MTATMHRWVQDDVIPDAVRSGMLKLPDLGPDDRCHVVAELTRRGESAQLIADRLGCSIRQVKLIRGQGMTQTLMALWKMERERDKWRRIAEQPPLFVLRCG